MCFIGLYSLFLQGLWLGFCMWDFFIKGGPLMWPILLASVWALAIIMERFWFFFQAERHILIPWRESVHFFEKGDQEKAWQWRDQINHPIRELMGLNSKEELQAGVSRWGSVLLRSMEKHLRSLAIIGNISPILGLLGTVTGMIQAFMKIQELKGQADAALLAGGIWEALLTTAFGLAVSVPAQIAYHYFEGKVDEMQDQVQSIGQRMIDKKNNKP